MDHYEEAQETFLLINIVHDEKTLEKLWHLLRQLYQLRALIFSRVFELQTTLKV